MFAFESASDPIYYGGNFAAANDVVLVSFDYRMNVFGTMNFAEIDSTFEDSGCLTLKDQVAALQWVKENIAEFGGNPDNITSFGESAGSVSIMLLKVAPVAKGIFDKAITQSSSLFFYNKPEKSAKIAEMFIQLSGAKNMGELMKKSADEIKSIYQKISEIRGLSLMDFMPTCEGKFLPLNPGQALKDGAAKDIKFIIGTTADEWRYFLLADKNLFKIFREDPEKNSPVLTRYKAQTAEEIYKSWLKNHPDSEDTYGDFLTQLDWRVSQEWAAEYQSNFDDVYYYLFSQHSAIENLRSCHGIEFPFTFNTADDVEPNPKQDFVKVIQSTWATFATTGNPNNELIPHWKKYSAQNRQTMEFNSKGCILHKDLNTENLDALRYIYEN